MPRSLPNSLAGFRIRHFRRGDEAVILETSAAAGAADSPIHAGWLCGRGGFTTVRQNVVYRKVF